MKTKLIFYVLGSIITASLFLTISCASFQQAVYMKCDNRINPIDIDIARPLLSWQVADNRRGAAQTAYQILVANEGQLLDKDEGNIWDSGKVTSSQSIHIPYNGKPLQSTSKYYWKVKIWDHLNKPAKWSEVGFWETSLMAHGDWEAEWIGSDLNNYDTEHTYVANWIWTHDEANTPLPGTRFFRHNIIGMIKKVTSTVAHP